MSDYDKGAIPPPSIFASEFEEAEWEILMFGEIVTPRLKNLREIVTQRILESKDCD